ncbi:MAG: C2 family cysteine protease [Methanomicrobiales archaeon]|nr:C2 family cysteine protease [Methanomicrobiales archaeon]
MSPSVGIAKKTVKTAVKKPVKKIRAVIRDDQNMGARNPYALADAVLGERQNWQRMGTARKKSVLEEALRRPYDELFDPKYGSPLFSRKLIGRLKGEEVRTQAGGPCSASIDHWGPVDGGVYFKDPKTDRGYLQDPVQGGVGDCYLIAACTALAWVSPQLIPSQAGPVYTYPFRNITATGGDATVTTSSDLPLDVNGNPVYGRSSDPKETWLAMVEKAYGIGKGLPGADIGHPDWDQDTGGNAVTALAQIAKAVNAAYTSTTVQTAGRTWAQMMTTIGTNKFEPANSCTVTFSKTKYPMVAFTYETAPAGVTYNSDTIVANHAYAVLGLYRYNNRCHVVLRNPYGSLAGDPALGESLASGDWTVQTSRYYQRLGQVYAAIRADSYTVNLADNDGTFALDANVFMTHFKALGYIG